MNIIKKRVLRKADGRIFNNINELVNDLRCPGPCVDGLCPLSGQVKVDDDHWTQKCNPKYYTEHPEDILELLGCEFLEEPEQDLYILLKDNTDVTFKANEFDGFTFDGNMLVVVKNNRVIYSYNTDIVYSAELTDPEDEGGGEAVHFEDANFAIELNGSVKHEEGEDPEDLAKRFLADIAATMCDKGWTVESMNITAEGLSSTGPADE